MGGLYFFGPGKPLPPGLSRKSLGENCRKVLKLMALDIPLPPGFILDTSIFSLEALASRSRALKKSLDTALAVLASSLGRKFGDPQNPLLLKITLSPDLAFQSPVQVRGLGLVRPFPSSLAAAQAPILIRDMIRIGARLAGLEGDARQERKLQAALERLNRDLGREEEARADLGDEFLSINDDDANDAGDAAAYDVSGSSFMEAPETIATEDYEKFLPSGFFDSPQEQLAAALEKASRLLALDREAGGGAILVEALVYPNRDGAYRWGSFLSRDPVKGEKKPWGFFRRGDGKGGTLDIGLLDPPYLEKLRSIGQKLEDTYREIRLGHFVVEEGRLWLTGQFPPEKKSAAADIKLLLDLAERKILDNAQVIKALDIGRLGEFLIPGIESAGLENLKAWRGGIIGAPGAAVGRVCFSARALLEERRRALREGGDSRFILVLPSSFAGDVKAIEVSAGVLTRDGGYASHASVVARQYGKLSLVAPELRISGEKAVLGDLHFSQGDFITLHIPSGGKPAVYAGEAKLTGPDPQDPGLKAITTLAGSFLKDFHVRANADSPGEAALALSLGARGIGLCRTEHMFFGPERLNPFREALFTADAESRARALAKLRRLQRKDFEELFTAAPGGEVCIRLLDAPLHEFMPRGREEVRNFINYMQSPGKGKESGKIPKKAEILEALETAAEINPMLGRRGCRVALSRPEIYAMQTQAIFEAACRVRLRGIEPKLEILVPLVMNARELRLIAYGKKIEGSSYAGIADIEEQVRAEMKAPPVPYRIGAMIEIPAAALGAGEIARYAAFFSFGANDLTQCTLGISRDDAGSFLPDYSRFDLLEADPFGILDRRVKELITLALRRGRLTRPGLVCGLCGEQAALSENIRFCVEAGLDYVSCPPRSVPLAILAAAQAELENSGSHRPPVA